jgi:3-deoxy-D-manno-octulosonate cytidylyltransferase
MLLVLMGAGVQPKKTKVLGVIPARYKSTRFEGKPLVLIDGIPMLLRTYQQVKKSERLDDIIVATEDRRIYDFCCNEGIPVEMTSDSCLTGTDRLVEISKRHDYDLYVNIQGDEPVIDPKAIGQIVGLYHDFSNDYNVCNLYKVIDDEIEIKRNTIVKVVVNQNDEAMYFSRFPIPYSKSNSSPDFKQHIPIYGFTKHALNSFSSVGKTINEKYEDIELLRFLDLGMKIKVQETFADSISVDVPSDVNKVEDFLKGKV